MEGESEYKSVGMGAGRGKSDLTLLSKRPAPTKVARLELAKDVL